MRPQILFPLFADLTTIKGVGPRLAVLIEKVARGARVKDLAMTAPTGNPPPKPFARVITSGLTPWRW